MTDQTMICCERCRPFSGSAPPGWAWTEAGWTCPHVDPRLTEDREDIALVPAAEREAWVTDENLRAPSKDEFEEANRRADRRKLRGS